MREAASFIASQASLTPAGALPSLLHAVQSAFRAWRGRYQLRQLNDLDDHLLCDIGVAREDVRWALDLPFSHDPGLALQRRALRKRDAGWRQVGKSGAC